MCIPEPTRILARAAFLLACLFFSAEAFARWYQVEVIVFRHNDGGNVDGEQWPELQRLPNFATAVELVGGDDVDREQTAGEPIAFRSLAAGALRLGGIYRRLQNLGAYEPLLHVGWRQPGYSASSVRRVYLSDRRRGSMFDEQPIDLLSDVVEQSAWVEGTVGLQGGRLLHVGANFLFRGAGITAEVNEFRRIKLKELHYFDHPLFGVLVQVTPYRATSSRAVGEPEDVAEAAD